MKTIVVDTRPITPEHIARFMEMLYRKRRVAPEYPKQCIDPDKLAAIEFRAFYEPSMDMMLTSGSEMRRARDAMAIWYEDENGNRS